MEFETFADGFVVLGDCTKQETFDLCANLITLLKLDANEVVIVSDPPYGNVVDEKWDKISESDSEFAKWMLSWTTLWASLLPLGGAMYIWGGVGQPGFRPFMKYVPLVEENTDLKCHNFITWSKKRAYGVQHNYLFTREELAYFVNGGDPKHPRVFNVPYLDEKRGYDGYDPEHPAKSEYFRRTNVWKDVTEIFRGKTHACQKPTKLYEIVILASSKEDDIVVDMFAGSGTAAFAARNLGRRFLLVESNREDYEKICKKLALERKLEKCQKIVQSRFFRRQL